MNGNTASVGYRYIMRQPGVRSGYAIIEGTRIGVHDVIGLLQNGETVDTIVARCFPNIPRAQVYECLAYYEDRTQFPVLSHTLPASATIDGLLGLDFLRAQRLVIDFRQGAISLS